MARKFLGWSLFGKAEPAGPTCPYCAAPQDPPPQRRRKCRDCGQKIYILRDGKRRRLTTEQEFLRIERARQDKQFKELSQQVKRALQEGDWNSASHAYHGQTAILFAEGGKHHHVAQEAHRCSLMGMRKAGIKKVSISTCDDERVCPECRSLEGKTLTIKHALENMPLPGDRCEDGAGKNPHGGRCRCLYQPVLPG